MMDCARIQPVRRSAGSRTGSRAERARGGFSLLELSLVVVIMGILIAVVATNVLGRGEEAKRRATVMKLQTIKSSIEQYRLEHSAFPADINTLITARYIERGKENDAWNKPLFYDPRGRSEDQPFLLSSNGPDGQLGTADDISVWVDQGSGGSSGQGTQPPR